MAQCVCCEEAVLRAACTAQVTGRAPMLGGGDIVAATTDSGRTEVMRTWAQAREENAIVLLQHIASD